MSEPDVYGEPVDYVCDECGEPGEPTEYGICTACVCGGCGDPRARHEHHGQRYCDHCAWDAGVRLSPRLEMECAE